MKNLLSYDNWLIQFLMKFCSACCLGFLWLVSSIPVFTIGAASTALYSVSIKLVRGTEGSILRQYAAAFRSNFKQATQLWLILLAAGAFLATDGYILYHLRQSSTGTMAILWTLFLAIILAAAVLYSMVMAFIFPMLAYFDNDNLSMLRNAFMVSARYLFCTIAVLGIHFAMLWVIINLFTPLLLFGAGLTAFACSYLLSNVLLAISGEKQEDPSDPDDSDTEAQ